jgi:hypothetical protein
MRSPPCSGFCGLSWSCAVLRGHERSGLGRILVPSGLHGVRRPPGIQPRRLLPACAVSDPPWTSALLQSSITGTPRRPHRLPGVSGRHFLSWTSAALRHMPARWTRLPIADPSAVACHVRGLVTPLAASTIEPPDASSASERPWASPFKDFPSLRSVPLSGPVPSCRYRLLAAFPEVGDHNLAGFKALFPQRVRTATGTRGFRPSIPSWV